jgi:hypothetical protein
MYTCKPVHPLFKTDRVMPMVVEKLEMIEV